MRATAVALAAAAVCATPASPAVAAPQPGDDPALAVAEQRFALGVGEDWTATIVVVDPDGALDEVVATAPTSTTSTSATSSPAGTNPTTTRPTAPAVDATVTVALGRSIHDRADLAAALDPTDGDDVTATDTVVVPVADVLTRGEEDALELAVPLTGRAEAGSLAVRAAGLYPVVVSVSVDGDELASTTTVIQVVDEEPSGDPPVGLALTAAVEDPGPAPDPAASRTAREQLAALARFGETTDAPLSLALPPSLTELLADDDDLRAGVADAVDTGELLALPYLTLDPSSAVAAGRADAFSREVRRGEDALAAAFPGVSVRRSAWLVLDPLSRPAAAELRDPLGYRLLVLDQATYESMPGSISTYLDASLAVAVDLGGSTTMQGAVVSPLGLDAGAADARTPTERAVGIVAAVLVNREELGPELRRNVVLTADGFDLPDPDTVAALDQVTSESPDLRLRTLSELVGTTDTMMVGDQPVTLELPETAGVDLSTRTERIDLVRVSAESAASMLSDAEQRREWLDELDALVSTGLTDEQADAELARITGEIEAVLGSVELPEPFTFTLTGRSADLRINVRNNADGERTVLVRAISPKLEFPEGDQLVTLAPGVTEVVIPVEARANGSSSVEVQLLTPVFGQRIGPSAFLEARVNAISGLGPLITGIAIVLLLSWWFSHFRRRRRARLAALAVVDEYDPDPLLSPDAAEATAVPTPSAPVDDPDSVPGS